jgi:hypothetical protein
LVIDNEQLLSNFPFEKRYNDIRRSGVYCLWKATSEWCKIRILERWKLCVPMSSSHMEKWPVEGNQLLLSGLPGKKPLLLTIKDFWKARPVWWSIFTVPAILHFAQASSTEMASGWFHFGFGSHPTPTLSVSGSLASTDGYRRRFGARNRCGPTIVGISEPNPEPVGSGVLWGRPGIGSRYVWRCNKTCAIQTKLKRGLVTAGLLRNNQSNKKQEAQITLKHFLVTLLNSSQSTWSNISRTSWRTGHSSFLFHQLSSHSGGISPNSSATSNFSSSTVIVLGTSHSLSFQTWTPLGSRSFQNLTDYATG